MAGKSDKIPGCSDTSLQKKIRHAGSKLTRLTCWLDSCTPSDCDIVIQFPRDANTYTIQWTTNIIEQSSTGIELNVCKHDATGLTNVLCSCSFQGLLKGAEEIFLKKRLKPEHGGQLRDFFMEDALMYWNIENSAEFFTSQERQQITLHLLNNIRLTQSHKILGHIMVQGQAIVPRLVTTKLIKQIYPIHCDKDLDHLRKKWVFDFTALQPLDAIADYFGVHIGMYFAFLGHYTLALTVPAFLGVIIWIYSGSSQEQDDVTFVVFALLNVIWSTVYIELWKRKEAEHAFNWGTLDRQDDLITEPRPLYTGELRTSPVTGRLEPHFPKWKRNLFFYTVSLPVMAICHCFIVLVCFNFFTLYDIINERVASGQLYFIFKPVPNIFLAVAVMVMDKVYGMIAVWLNDKENYRNEEEYKNQLIIKLMVFQSVNSFLSLFYTAFYIQDFNRLRNQLAVLFVVRQVVGNMKESLLSFFFAKVRQYEGAAGATTGKEILLKLKKRCVSAATRHQCRDTDNTDQTSNDNNSHTDNVETVHGVCDDVINTQDETTPDAADTCVDDPADTMTFTDTVKVGGERTRGQGLTQAESEGLLPQYEGTFEDYLEMVIQFSYVTWFSSVFPLAGFFALLNNIVEIRSDAFKICMSFQRPMGERVRNIGAWQTVLEIMSIGTIIVNTALIGISGPMQRLFPDLTSMQRLLIIVVMEHVVLAIKFIIRVAIAEVPEWVSIEMAKLEFSRREALRSRLQEHMNELNNPQELHSHPPSAHPPGHQSDTEICDEEDVIETQSGMSSLRNSPMKPALLSQPVTPAQSPLTKAPSSDSDRLDETTDNDILLVDLSEA